MRLTNPESRNSYFSDQAASIRRWRRSHQGGIPADGAARGTNEWYAVAKIAAQDVQAYRREFGSRPLSVDAESLRTGDNFDVITRTCCRADPPFHEAKLRTMQGNVWGTGTPAEFLHVDDMRMRRVSAAELHEEA